MAWVDGTIIGIPLLALTLLTVTDALLAGLSAVARTSVAVMPSLDEMLLMVTVEPPLVST